MTSIEINQDTDALVVVDVQNDFCPGGALEVPNGDEVVAPINSLIGRFKHVLLTQDWHPVDHISFASMHDGQNPFETIEVDYGVQVLWPNHCVQGTAGAEFHADLNVDAAELVIRKGYRQAIDSYSALYENDHTTPTGLSGYLRDRGFKRLFMAGLATDSWPAWRRTTAWPIQLKTAVGKGSRFMSSRTPAAALTSTVRWAPLGSR